MGRSIFDGRGKITDMQRAYVIILSTLYCMVVLIESFLMEFAGTRNLQT